MDQSFRRLKPMQRQGLHGHIAGQGGSASIGKRRRPDKPPGGWSCPGFLIRTESNFSGIFLVRKEWHTEKGGLRMNSSALPRVKSVQNDDAELAKKVICRQASCAG